VGERVGRLVSPVIAEHPCRDRSIGRAADRVEQTQVVRILSLVLAQTGALGELDGEQAGAQSVLGRLARAKVGGQGEGRKQLSRAHARRMGPHGARITAA